MKHAFENLCASLGLSAIWIVNFILGKSQSFDEFMNDNGYEKLGRFGWVQK